MTPPESDRQSLHPCPNHLTVLRRDSPECFGLDWIYCFCSVLIGFVYFGFRHWREELVGHFYFGRDLDCCYPEPSRFDLGSGREFVLICCFDR